MFGGHTREDPTRTTPRTPPRTTPRTTNQKETLAFDEFSSIDDFAVVDVTDAGPDIPAADPPYVFDRFPPVGRHAAADQSPGRSSTVKGTPMRRQASAASSQTSRAML